MKILFYISPLFLLISCVSSTQKEHFGVDRQQLLVVSATEVENSADKACKEILSESEKNKTLNTDKKMKQLSSGGGAPPEILSTNHPSHETRINDLKKYAKLAGHLY